MGSILTIKIAGPAGAGIKSAGQIFAKFLIASGFHLFDYTEYPSLVRGGHNTYQICFSDEPVSCAYHHVDLFFSLKPGHWQAHLDEFDKNSFIFSDEVCSDKKCDFHTLPLTQLAASVGNPIVANTICLGVAAYVLNLKLEKFEKIIVHTFGKNADINIKALKEGYEYAKEHYQKLPHLITPKKVTADRILADGNEAFGWGFLAGGGNFYAAYPMTPATGTLHFLAQKKEEYKINVIHPEDEIAAANLICGAAFAGARAATGSSGGGFALMTESISFAGVAELGVVYYLVSRPGPATGLPTWTAQGDLLYAIHAGHGEFPKIVLSPASQQESFEFSALALNLAAKYQLPVIVVSDKYIGESSADLPDYAKVKVKIEKGEIVKNPDENFARYTLKTTTGVSPFTIPGTKNGEFLANSYEHDELGFSTENAALTAAMNQKRAKKLKSALKDITTHKLFGTKKAKKLVIAWGSPVAVLKETQKLTKNNFDLLQITCLAPLDPKIEKIIADYKEIIVVENNHTSQLTQVIKSNFNFNPSEIIVKFDGRPFYPEELYAKLK